MLKDFVRAEYRMNIDLGECIRNCDCEEPEEETDG